MISSFVIDLGRISNCACVVASSISVRPSSCTLDEIHVDLVTELHTFLEVMLVVCFSALGLNVLLNGVNLGLIVNELLLNIIQAVEYLTLQDLVLRGIMLHRMIGDLLAQVVLVDIEESLD